MIDWSPLNLACRNRFGIGAVHLESGIKFQVIPDSGSGIAQLAETRRQSFWSLLDDVPITLERNHHLVSSSDTTARDVNLYEVVALQDSMDGFLHILVEQQDWKLLPALTTEADVVLITEVTTENQIVTI